jgi:hypothetical protein
LQIALTKKLADAMGLKPSAIQKEANPLFSWTANWTNAWADEGEDMLVLVNNATRFTVAVYQVSREEMDYAEEIMQEAIRSTLLAMKVNPGIVEEYMRLAGDVEFVQNKDRSRAAWVTRAGLECALHVGREYEWVEDMFCDQVGINANYYSVRKNQGENFYPYQAMFQSLTELTGKPLYNFRAFELLVTLDLEVYKATRRLIVPADIGFSQLHKVLQSVFDWENRHLYDFRLYDNSEQLITMFVPFEETLELHPEAVLQEKYTLSDVFPEHKSMLYTYDMGDNWVHEIELLQVLENYDQESPYLLEASGQAPPEDVGGVPGFLLFREIMLDPKHPQHDELKAWFRFWNPEFSYWKRQPRPIRV